MEEQKNIPYENLHQFLVDMYERGMQEYKEKQKLKKQESELNKEESKQHKTSSDDDDETFVSNGEGYRYFKQQREFIDNTIALTKDKYAWDDVLQQLNETTIIDKNEKALLKDVCAVYMIINNKDEYYKTDDDREYLKTKISTLRGYRNLVNKKSEIKITINYHLWKIVSDVVKKYAVRIGVGRRKGMGRSIVYNNKHYTSIQSCANEYGISKQAMHKRLKKLNII
jgi:hypothetical protein